MRRADSIGSWLQNVAETRGPAPAIVDAEGVSSWSEFGARIRKTGRALLDAGLRAGDRVALLLPDRRIYLEADYGAMSAGLVRVPLDPRLPRADLISLLHSSGARALVSIAGSAPPDLRGEAPDLQFEFIYDADEGTAGGDFHARVRAASDEPLPDVEPSALATLNYSGGTTGKPKGIALSHGNLCAVLTHTIDAFAIRPDNRFLNVRPLWPIAQLVMMSHLAAGGCVALGGRFAPQSFAALVESSEADRTSLVPTHLHRLLDFLAPNDSRLRRLETLYIGGSRLPADMFERALELVGPRVGILYGMTEAPISCWLSPKMAASSIEARNTVGRPCPDCQIAVATETGRTVDSDIVGEVLIRGPHVMAGYWRDAEASRAALVDGWLHTGDIGRFDAEHRLEIVGRIKEIIRSGAQSVVPGEVEDVLMQHPDIAEAAVIGIPDPEWGEAVTAFVVTHAGVVIDAPSLTLHCRERLASFKVPRTFHFVDYLPRSHYGKVLRMELIDRLRPS